MTQLWCPRKEAGRPAGFSLSRKAQGMTWPNPRGPGFSHRLHWLRLPSPSATGGEDARGKGLTQEEERGTGWGGTGLPSYLHPQQKSTGRLEAPQCSRLSEGLGHLLSPLSSQKRPTFAGAPGTSLAMGTVGKASLRCTGSLTNTSAELQGLPPSPLSPGRPCEGDHPRRCPQAGPARDRGIERGATWR